MDDYENIFNGAGSAPTAAGGAASLGPDAAGYAPTAAATPTPRQTSSVDALAPLARQQATTALSLGASALSPENRQRWMPPHTEGDALSALVPPTTAGRNLTDGVFTQGGMGQPTPGTKPNVEEIAQRLLQDERLRRIYGSGRNLFETQNRTPLPSSNNEMIDRMLQDIRNRKKQRDSEMIDRFMTPHIGPYKQPLPRENPIGGPDPRTPLMPLSMVNPPNGGKPYATYQYGGQTVLLGDDVDVNDSAAVQTRMAETNSLIDMMNEAYE